MCTYSLKAGIIRRVPSKCEHVPSDLVTMIFPVPLPTSDTTATSSISNVRVDIDRIIVWSVGLAFLVVQSCLVKVSCSVSSLPANYEIEFPPTRKPFGAPRTDTCPLARPIARPPARPAAGRSMHWAPAPRPPRSHCARLTVRKQKHHFGSSTPQPKGSIASRSWNVAANIAGPPCRPTSTVSLVA